MTQHPDNLLAPCHVCGVGSGNPCFTQDGETAERVHHGRVARSIEAAMDPTFPRPLTPDQKAERWNRLITGGEDTTMRIWTTEPDPTPERSAHSLSPAEETTFDQLIGEIEAEANPRPRSRKVHYRHERLASTPEHPTRWADAQLAPRVHAACGLFVPPDRVTDEGELVDCKRCAEHVPPSYDTLAELCAQMDADQERKRRHA